MKKKQRRRTRFSNRRGGAAVECAFCIPIVLLIMFATLEICSGIFLKETLTVAAYEGARTGVRKRATRADAEAQVRSVLEARGVTNFDITIEPKNFKKLNALDPITVTVMAPSSGNSLYVFDFMADRQVAGQVSMVREFDE